MQPDQVQTWFLSGDGQRLTEDMLIDPPNHGPEVHVLRVFDKKN
jgi:hypothetical protein